MSGKGKWVGQIDPAGKRHVYYVHKSGQGAELTLGQVGGPHERHYGWGGNRATAEISWLAECLARQFVGDRFLRAVTVAIMDWLQTLDAAAGWERDEASLANLAWEVVAAQVAPTAPECCSGTPSTTREGS